MTSIFDNILQFNVRLGLVLTRPLNLVASSKVTCRPCEMLED